VLKDPGGRGPKDASRIQPAWTDEYSGGLMGVGYSGQTSGRSGSQILGRFVVLVLDAVAISFALEKIDGASEKLKQDKSKEEEKDDSQEQSKEKRRFSKKDREEAFENSKDADGKPKCEYCNQELKKEKGSGNSYEADHKEPYSKGGKSTKDNLAPSCRDCNRSKSDQTWQEWQDSQKNW